MNGIGLQEVEGDRSLLNDVLHRVRVVAAQFHVKFELLFVVPCLLAVSDRAVGARDAIIQINDPRLVGFHEPATLWWGRNMMPDLQSVSDGGRFPRNTPKS